MKIFESKPWYLWTISIVLSYFLLLIIAPFNLGFTIVWSILFSLVVLQLRKFEFFEDTICKNFILRPKWLLKKKWFSYQDIFLVEVRRIYEPKNWPYVILHFSAKQVKSGFFVRRSFIYKSISELDPLIYQLIKNEVPIKINISSKYKQDKIELIEIMKKYDGTYIVEHS